MEYFQIIAANSMLERGLIPAIKKTDYGVVAGFGRFSFLENSFEYPIEFNVSDSGNIVFKLWSIDTTEVVYQVKQKHGGKHTIHCNLTDLSLKVAPFIHLFCFNKIRDIICNNKQFIFYDDITEAEVTISPKTKVAKFG